MLEQQFERLKKNDAVFSQMEKKLLERQPKSVANGATAPGIHIGRASH